MRSRLGSLRCSTQRPVCLTTPRHASTSAIHAPPGGSGPSKHGLELLSVAPGLAKSRPYLQLLEVFETPSHLSSPDATWRAYSSLVRVNALDQSRIPIEIHRRALRRTLPLYSNSMKNSREEEAQRARKTASHSSLAGGCPYQRRIDLIVESIRQLGSFPHLDDCHLIMLHNAVWGNVKGSIGLLDDLIETGMKPTERTYELVLYSIVRKLELVRNWEQTRPIVLELIEPVYARLVEDMRAREIPRTPKIAEHCTYIIGAVSPPTEFARAVAGVYGIDVHQPDVIPLAFVEQSTRSNQHAASTSSCSTVTLPVVSTSALNTLVRVLGSGPSASLGAMVGAFETLTNPIPPLRTNTEAYGYEDGLEDDDEPHTPAPTVPPTAYSLRRNNPTRPNTQTYFDLINNCLDLKCLVLAKHYLDEAIAAESARLKSMIQQIRDILRDPSHPSGHRIHITEENMERVRNEVPRGRISVNAYMFKALYRYADMNQNAALMRWIMERQIAAMKQKKKSVKLFKTVVEAMEAVRYEAVEARMPNTSLASIHSLLEEHTRSVSEITSELSRITRQIRETEPLTSRAESAIKRHRRPSKSVATEQIPSTQFSNEELDPAVETISLETVHLASDDAHASTRMHWGSVSPLPGSFSQDEEDRFLHVANAELRQTLTTTPEGSLGVDVSSLSPDVLNASLTPDSLRNTLPSPSSPSSASSKPPVPKNLSAKEKLAFFESNNATNSGTKNTKTIVHKGTANPRPGLQGQTGSAEANSQSQSSTTNASQSQPHDLNFPYLPSS